MNDRVTDTEDAIDGLALGDTNVIETVKVNGTALSVTDKAVDVTVPTKTSDLTNDSGFITSAGVTGVKGDSESTYRTGDVNITAANVGAATSSHTHGYINNDGSINAATTIGNNDTLVIRDYSNSYKILASTITFDGSTTTTALTPKGTFETFLQTAPVTSVNGNTGAVTISVPTKVSDLTNDSGFTTNTGTITGVTMNGVSKGTSGVVDLGTVITDVSGKADASAAIGTLSLAIDNTNYQITLSGTKVDGTTFTVSNVIDLPLESVVVNGSYNNTTKKVVLTLQNGNTIDFSVADLIAGLQSEITSTNKLSADLISDGTTNKVVTATEKST